MMLRLQAGEAVLSVLESLQLTALQHFCGQVAGMTPLAAAGLVVFQRKIHFKGCVLKVDHLFFKWPAKSCHLKAISFSDRSDR